MCLLSATVPFQFLFLLLSTPVPALFKAVAPVLTAVPVPLHAGTAIVTVPGVFYCSFSLFLLLLLLQFQLTPLLKFFFLISTPVTVPCKCFYYSSF